MRVGGGGGMGGEMGRRKESSQQIEIYQTAHSSLFLFFSSLFWNHPNMVCQGIKDNSIQFGLGLGSLMILMLCQLHSHLRMKNTLWMKSQKGGRSYLGPLHWCFNMHVSQNIPLSIMVGSRWSFIVTGDPTCTLFDRWLANRGRQLHEKEPGKKLLLTSWQSSHMRNES